MTITQWTFDYPSFALGVGGVMLAWITVNIIAHR